MNKNFAGWLAALCVLLPSAGWAADTGGIVDRAVRPVMARYGIPGMAVGITQDGHDQVFDYGVASKATGQKVTDDTLFEICSVSKTFTASLAAYAQLGGKLSLDDDVSQYLPELRGGVFDRITLRDLGTHTAGGLPLQFPDGIAEDSAPMEYFRAWRPDYPPGTHRLYSNPSIGLLGLIAAQALRADFTAVIEKNLFPALGLRHSFLTVPNAAMRDYAEGYTETDQPIRMNPGPLAAETYGVRANAGDLLRFVRANMGLLPLDATWQRAITATHTGYDQIGAMTQDLVWEQYRYPATLADLQAGNSAQIMRQANQVTVLAPALAPQDHVLINKTGSTNGFGAYVMFVPARHIGIVVLANKNYPVAARVGLAYQILADLAGKGG